MTTTIAGQAMDASAVLLPSVVDRKCLELYTLDNRVLSFKTGRGQASAKAFVISMQKAGTYLMAKILEEIGLVDLEIHITSGTFSDYRHHSLIEKLERAREYTFTFPIEFSASLIHTGQFAVGHLYHEARIIDVLAEFARIVCVRDVRDALSSMMRFEFRRMSADPLRYPNRRAWISEPTDRRRMLGFVHAFGPELIADFERIRPWCDDQDSVVARFETIMGDDGQDSQIRLVSQICAKLGVWPESTGDAILARSMFTETLTYSGKRTDYRRFWSSEVDDAFNSMGGNLVNSSLGYLSS